MHFIPILCSTETNTDITFSLSAHSHLHDAIKNHLRQIANLRTLRHTIICLSVCQGLGANSNFKTPSFFWLLERGMKSVFVFTLLLPLLPIETYKSLEQKRTNKQKERRIARMKMYTSHKNRISLKTRYLSISILFDYYRYV